MDAVKVALAWLAASRGRDSGRCMLKIALPDSAVGHVSCDPSAQQW